MRIFSFGSDLKLLTENSFDERYGQAAKSLKIGRHISQGVAACQKILKTI